MFYSSTSFQAESNADFKCATPFFLFGCLGKDVSTKGLFQKLKNFPLNVHILTPNFDFCQSTLNELSYQIREGNLESALHFYPGVDIDYMSGKVTKERVVI